MDERNGLRLGATRAQSRMMLPAVALLLLVLSSCCLGLLGCKGQPEAAGKPDRGEAPVLTTPAYYVFESKTIDGTTIYDPSDFFLDRPQETENWYYLTIAIQSGTGGRLCTDGRIADFTYERKGDAIVLDVPLDFGFDGARLELGEGTLTMRDVAGMTVLRQVDEAPAAALVAH